jgi:hypothetical protein
MNGVEILSSETIYNTILPDWCLVLGVIGAFMGIYVTVQLFFNCDDIAPWIFLVVAIACAVVAILSVIPNKNNVDHVEYKVAIDDSVSMNEFLDKYEILDQEGKIYTVKENQQ